MALIHRQDDNGNQQPPQGDQGAGNEGGGGGGDDTQPSDGGGQASLPFVDPASSTAPVSATTLVVPPPASATGFVPVGSGVAQNPSGESLISTTGLSAAGLSGTLTVNVSTGTAIVPNASAAPNQSSSQPATALGLSLPVLIGIIAGVFAFLLIVLIIVIMLYRRAGRKRRAQNSLHSHDSEGLPYAGGGGSRNRSKGDELTPPPTPAPLSHKAMMQEKQRDLAALDALVSALDQAQSRSGSAQRYDPSRSGPGAGSVAKLKAATTRQSDFLEWDDEEDESSEFDAKRQKRRTVDMLPDAEVFRAAIAPKHY